MGENKRTIYLWMRISSDGDSDSTRLSDVHGEVLEDVRESRRTNLTRFTSESCGRGVGRLPWRRLPWRRGDDINVAGRARVSGHVPCHDAVVARVFRQRFVNLQRRPVSFHAHLPAKTKAPFSMPYQNLTGRVW